MQTESGRLPAAPIALKIGAAIALGMLAGLGRESVQPGRGRSVDPPHSQRGGDGSRRRNDRPHLSVVRIAGTKIKTVLRQSLRESVLDIA